MAVPTIASAPGDSLLFPSNHPIPDSKVFVQFVQKAFSSVPIGGIGILCVRPSFRNAACSYDKLFPALDSGDGRPLLRNLKVSSPLDADDSVDVCECRQVKRVRVRRGTKLRLQMLRCDAERCGVFESKALMTRCDYHALISENQSAKISNASPLSKSGRA
jgi:hypothetical protein